MSCSYCDGWSLSVSSSVIDFYGNSSECNQTSETLNTHVHTHTHGGHVDLKAVIVNVKAINVSSVDWEDLPQAYSCETLSWTLMFVLLSFSFVFHPSFFIILSFSAGDSGWTSCGRAAIWCWVFQEVPQSEYCSVSKNVLKGKSLFLCSPSMTWASVTGSCGVSYSHHFTVLWISVCALASVWRKIWIPSLFWVF